LSRGCRAILEAFLEFNVIGENETLGAVKYQ